MPVAGDAPRNWRSHLWWRTSTRARGSTRRCPQADNVNITCVGRVFDRYLSFAEAYAPARVDALEMSTEDLSAFAGDLLSATADTGDGEASLSLISNVASVIGGDEETGVNGTSVEKTPENSSPRSRP